MEDFESMSDEQHLECAIAISAYSYLHRDGILPEDRQLPKDGLHSLMWHNNAYAISRDLGEKTVADLINQGRERLIKNSEPEAIFDLATRCSAATPDT